MSRVRENRMHGSTRRREETGTSRHSRAVPGASHDPTVCSEVQRLLAAACDPAAAVSDPVRPPT